MNQEILSILSIFSTVVVGIWLIKQNKALNKLVETQSKMIETQNTQLKHVTEYTDILKKYNSPAETEKFLDNKIKLLEQEYEFKYINKINEISKTVSLEIGKKIELENLKKFDTGFDELLEFSIGVFIRLNFEDKIKRNIIIKESLPTFSEFIIQYLDDSEKPSKL
jgi:hypothetical protein